MTATRYQILVCRGPTCGGKRDSSAVYEELCALVSSYGLNDRIDIGWQSCFGRCTRGPNALVRESGARAGAQFALATLPLARGGLSALYGRLRPSDASDLIHEHVLRGRIVERLVDAPRPSRPEAEPRVAAAGGAGNPRTDGEG